MLTLVVLLLMVKRTRKRELISVNFVIDLRRSVLNHFSTNFLSVIRNARHLIASVAPDKYMHGRNAFKWS